MVEVNYVLKAIENNEFAKLDGIVCELIKYGGITMYEIVTLFNLVWNNEYVPTNCREGLIFGLFKKGYR